jgi:hypothetical protein
LDSGSFGAAPEGEGVQNSLFNLKYLRKMLLGV